MKKVVAVFLAIAVLFAFGGCGGKKLSEEEIPMDAAYHTEKGILIELGMTKEEVDSLLNEYGWEDTGDGIIEYHLGRLWISYYQGKVSAVILKDFTAPEWKTKDVCIGTPYEEVKKLYGEPVIDGILEPDSERPYGAGMFIVGDYTLTFTYWEDTEEICTINIQESGM